MKSVQQILGKVSKLKRQLKDRAICENFGDRAQLLLSQYIGDVYDYSYDDRLMINAITSDFFNWCSTYQSI